MVQAQRLRVEHIPGNEQPADILTKQLPVDQFRNHINTLGMRAPGHSQSCQLPQELSHWFEPMDKRDFYGVGLHRWSPRSSTRHISNCAATVLTSTASIPIESIDTHRRNIISTKQLSDDHTSDSRAQRIPSQISSQPSRTQRTTNGGELRDHWAH